MSSVGSAFFVGSLIQDLPLIWNNAYYRGWLYDPTIISQCLFFTCFPPVLIIKSYNSTKAKWLVKCSILLEKHLSLLFFLCRLKLTFQSF